MRCKKCGEEIYRDTYWVENVKNEQWLHTADFIYTEIAHEAVPNYEK